MKGFLILTLALLSLSKLPSGDRKKLITEVTSDTLVLKADNYSFRIVKVCDSNAVSYISSGSIRSIPQLVSEDAEARAIRHDRVVIAFVSDSTCSISGVEIAKRGKLESFTDFVSEVCVELYQSIKDQSATEFFNCQFVKCSETTMLTIPIKLKIR